MKIISLTRDKVTLVDDEDFDRLNQFKWFAAYCPRRAGDGAFYAARTVCVGGLQGTVLMHREIMAAPRGVRIDHADRDSLNNQKINLRPVTASQNGANQGIPKHNTSGYKGVSFHKRHQKFIATIQFHGKAIHLGYFLVAEDAAEAYNEAASRLFGEFASLN